MDKVQLYPIVKTLRIHSILIVFLAIMMVYNVVYLRNIDDKLAKVNTKVNIVLDTVNLGMGDLEKLIKYDEKQINCLALAIYGEARGEKADSMIAVGYVIMNRAISSSSRYPNSPCKVILQRYQFEPIKGALKSMVLATLKGDLQFPYMQNAWLSRRIRAIARDIYYFQIPDPTNYATHFWSPAAQRALGRPRLKWSTELRVMARIGGHIYHE